MSRYDMPVVITVKATSEEQAEQIVKNFLKVATKDICVGDIIDWQFNTDFINATANFEDSCSRGCRDDY